MKYQVIDRMDQIKVSIIRTIVSMAKDNVQSGEKVIVFAGGSPATEALRDDLVRKYSNEVLEEMGKTVLQYGPHPGYDVPRAEILKFINKKEQLTSEDDDIVITYGANEIMYYVASLLVNPGDKIIVEDPTFVNCLNQYKMLGAQLVGVPVEDDGVDIAKLEEAMKQGAKFFYTIPNFGNPSGITMSLEKRKAVYELALKYNVLILEDNPYGYLRYRGEHIPSIKTMDKEGIVLYAGTFSKIISPGLRVGYFIGNKEFAKKFIAIKSNASSGNEGINQHTVAKILQNVDMEAHIASLQQIYKKKGELMYRKMKECFHPSIKIVQPDGGLFIWVTMPKGVKAMEFCEEAAKKLHIAIVPGNEFCTIDPENCSSMRFSYSQASEEDIITGIELVGKQTYRYCENLEQK